jgi:adenosylcobinamide-GDP ribazoletransferase
VSALIAAMRLLTVVPSGRRDLSAAALARSPALFPAVGLGIGLATAGVFVFSGKVMPAGVSAALALLTGVALSGALHLDGLADTADGLFGGRTPERRMEIMNDPRTGSYGVAAVALALSLKYGTVSALAGGYGWVVIALSPVTARAAVVVVMATFRYSSPDGLGAAYSAGARRSLPAAALVCAVTAVAFGGWWALAAALAAMAAGVLTGWLAAARLGGVVTGDVYGASVEVAEVVALVTFAGLTGAGVAIAPLWS